MHDTRDSTVAGGATGLDSHALVIGIDAYGGDITTLQTAVRDASAVATLLQTRHQYQVTTLLDQAATRAAILAAITSLCDRLTPDSALLVYYAGHGVAHGDGSDGPRGYLLPADATRADERTWLAMPDIVKALERLRCRHMLIVLDCCFAGAFRWASSRDLEIVDRPLYRSQYARYLAGKAWEALTSASADERAADLPGRVNLRDHDAIDGHSPFAAAFIRGLSGAADSSFGDYDADGVITAVELYQYICDRLRPRAGAAGPVQTPAIWPLTPTNKGEFIFLNPARPLNTREDPPLDDSHNPWLGLESYSREHADLFYGRQRVVDELLDRLTDGASRFVAVVGASGSGKSSVIKAGLLSQLTAVDGLRDKRIGKPWTVVSCARLTADPAAQIDAAGAELTKAPADAPKLLFIDQFEELYTQCADPSQRRAFLDRVRALVTGPDGTRVILTLRSDFEPRPASDGALSGDTWSKARFLVPAFTTEELREVIEAPARRKAVFFEQDEEPDGGRIASTSLVGLMLDDVAAMPGALPLLSFALAELYRQAMRRRIATGSADRALRFEDYHAIGGVIGALQKRAAEQYLAQDEAHRESVRKVFLRIVSQEGARLTRRRVERDELTYADPDENARVDAVVRTYVDARLLVVDDNFVEPAHDSLVVAWAKVSEWLAASGSQDLIRALWRQARDWTAHTRAKAFLWDRDPRLAVADANTGDLNALEREFVTASVRQKTRQRRRLVAASAAIFSVLLFAAIYSARQARIATDRSQDANARRLLFASRSQLGADNDVALLLALEGSRIRPLPEFAPVLRAGLAARGQIVKTLAHTCESGQNCTYGRVNFAAWDPSGQRVVSTSFDDDTVRVWEPKTGQTLLQCGLTGVSTAAWSPDGTRIIAGGMWENGATILTIGRPCRPGQPVDVSSMVHAAWRPDGTQVAVSTRTGRVSILSAATGTTIWSAAPGGTDDDGLSRQINVVEWNADGTRFVTAGNDGTARVFDWNGRTAVQRVVAEGHTPQGPAVLTAEWNPTPGDTRIVTALADGTARIWDGGTGKELGRLTGHTRALNSAKWNPAGTQIVTASLDSTARIWNDRGEAESFLIGHTGQVLSADWDPSGAFVITCSDDQTARVWDARTGDGRAVLTGHQGPVVAAAFAPGSASAAMADVMTASGDGRVRLWRPDVQGPASLTLTGDARGSEAKAKWSGDGSRIVTGGTKDGRVAVWDVNNPSGHVIELSTAGGVAHPGGATVVTFSPDDRRVLTAGDDGVARMWDAITGAFIAEVNPKAITRYTPPFSRIHDGSWSPDGKWFAVALHEYALVYDAANASAPPKQLRLPGDILSLNWHPLSSRLVVTNTGSSGDPWAVLWNPFTGRKDDLFRPAERGDLVWYAEWSRDGSRVVTAANDSQAIVWSADGKYLRRLPTTAAPQFAAWNGPGTRIATASDDKKTRIWDPERSRPLLELDERGDVPRYVAWSPDDRFVATANQGSRARVWDATTGAVVEVLSGHTGPVRSIAWNHTGSSVMTTGEDGTVRVYTLDGAALRDAACQRVTRNLTPEEWAAFMPGTSWRKTCPQVP
jgi:WD40 repeat protein